jgi:sortase A
MKVQKQVFTSRKKGTVIIMKIETIVSIAVVVGFIALCIVGGILSSAADGMRETGVENVVLEQEVGKVTSTNMPIPTAALVCEDTPMSTPSPPAANESQTTLSVAPVAESSAIASITIATDKKTRTYEIMEGVSEKTLERNIGHLPSSALPGQDGVCILMGHRDTDFSVLKYAKFGDEFSVSMNGEEFVYIVNGIEIVKSDSGLRFVAIEGKNLVLVTCYPFRYAGHAPQKYVVYCKMTD